MQTTRGIVFGVFFVSLILAVSVAVVAKPNFQAVDVNPSDGQASVTIPEDALKVAEGVFSLGTATDVDGRVVEGFMFIDYKKGFHHKPGHDKGLGGPGEGNGGGESTCFAHLAKGAKWKTLESWIVNPANTEGLSGTFVLNNLAGDIDKWETAAGVDILGSGSSTTDTLVADTSSPDDKNEVYFADISSEGAIAVTIVWGRFFGPPFARELVEWDQIYDDVDFDWSSTGESGKMDFENIATHELGHSVGMGHPDSSCTEETMYAFASFGETKKQTLESGDIAGVNNLYSA